MNWQCYGTSYVDKIAENESIWDSLLYKAQWDHQRNLHFKSILQPIYVSSCPSTHFAHYFLPYKHVDTHYGKVGDSYLTDTVNVDVLRIHHYWTRDEWFLYTKKFSMYDKFSHNAYVGDFSSTLKLIDEMNLCLCV